jgi:hypothetical protein
MEFVSARPEVVRFLQHVFIPDEIALNTIVSNSAFGQEITGYDLTYADWVRPNPLYPRVLVDQTDLQSLLQSTKLFARKFDALREPRLLNDIDALIFGARGVSEVRGT